MTVYQAPEDAALTDSINAELGSIGVTVMVDRYTTGADTMHGLCFCHGQRRLIRSQARPWSYGDIRDIVEAARKWMADEIQPSRRPVHAVYTGEMDLSDAQELLNSEHSNERWDD